ncbi:hypothetical protein COBT_003383, partial [Conglomerata obtusa]
MTIRIILYIRALYSNANAFNNNFETCITQSDEFVNFMSDYVITNANKDEEFRNEVYNILNKDQAFKNNGSMLQTQKPNEHLTLSDNHLSNAPNMEIDNRDAESNKNKRKNPSANTLNCTVSALHGKKMFTEKICEFNTTFFKFPLKNFALSDEYSIKLNYKCANDSILTFNTETLELNKSPICLTCKIYESFEEIKFQIYLKDATLWDNAQKYHNILQINVNMLLYRCNELMYYDLISNKHFCDIKKLLNLQQKTLKIDFESDTFFLDEKNFPTSSVSSNILHRNIYWFENNIIMELFESEMCCTTFKNDENSNLLNLNLDYEKGMCQYCLKKILMKLLFAYDTNTHKLHLKTIYYYLLLCVDDFLYIIWFILFNKEINECPYYVCKMFFNDMGNPDECSKNVSVNILRAFLAETFIINHRILVESFQTAKITPKKNLLNNQYYNLKYSYHKKNAFINVKKFEENLMFM